jgi:hypothetical protein
VNQAKQGNVVSCAIETKKERMMEATKKKMTIVEAFFR